MRDWKSESVDNEIVHRCEVIKSYVESQRNLVKKMVFCLRRNDSECLSSRYGQSSPNIVVHVHYLSLSIGMQALYDISNKKKKGTVV